MFSVTIFIPSFGELFDHLIKDKTEQNKQNNAQKCKNRSVIGLEKSQH